MSQTRVPVSPRKMEPKDRRAVRELWKEVHPRSFDQILLESATDFRDESVLGVVSEAVDDEPKVITACILEETPTPISSRDEVSYEVVTIVTDEEYRRKYGAARALSVGLSFVRNLEESVSVYASPTSEAAEGLFESHPDMERVSPSELDSDASHPAYRYDSRPQKS